MRCISYLVVFNFFKVVGRITNVARAQRPIANSACIKTGHTTPPILSKCSIIQHLAPWHHVCTPTTMLKNFLKVASRNLFRQKTYSILNVLGLSLGITCILLLCLHIRKELSYDKDFQKHDRIYRVCTTVWSKSSPPIGSEMIKAFPEVKSFA